MIKQPLTIQELMPCMSSFLVTCPKIGALMTVLPAERMMEVEQALAFALGMPRPR
jgi:hypothetical protein